MSWHPTPAWAPVVARPGWLGGVAVPTSFGWRWRPATGIASPGHGRAWPGLVAGEQSSGGRPSQGWITNTGNRHTRRLLVEAAWHHRNPSRPSRELRARHHQLPAVVRERADAGNRRLHQRWCRLDARAKRSTISVVAVARELAGWGWSLAVMDAYPSIRAGRWAAPTSARSDPRHTYEQPGRSNAG